jgi:hypothetical protein
MTICKGHSTLGHPTLHVLHIRHRNWTVELFLGLFSELTVFIFLKLQMYAAYIGLHIFIV